MPASIDRGEPRTKPTNIKVGLRTRQRDLKFGVTGLRHIVSSVRDGARGISYDLRAPCRGSGRADRPRGRRARRRARWASPFSPQPAAASASSLADADKSGARQRASQNGPSRHSNPSPVAVARLNNVLCITAYGAAFLLPLPLRRSNTRLPSAGSEATHTELKTGQTYWQRGGARGNRASSCA